MKKFLLLGFVFSIILLTMFQNFSICFITLLVFGMLAYINRNEDQQFFHHLMAIMLIALIFVIILHVYYSAIYNKPYYMGGSDDLVFESYAKNLIKLNAFTYNRALQIYPDYVANGFVWILSLFMRFCNLLGGYHTLSFKILNMGLLVMTGNIMFKYLKKTISNDKIKYYVLYIFCIFPNAMYISGHVFRDTVFCFLLVSLFYLFNIFIDSCKNSSWKRKVFYVLLFVLIIWFLYIIRTQGIIYAFIIICSITMFKYIRSWKKCIFVICILGIIGVVIYPKIILVLQNYINFYTELYLAEQSGLSRYVFSTPILPFGIFFRIGYGICYPFPNTLLNLFNLSVFTDFHALIDFFIAIGTIFQIYTIPYFVKGFKHNKSLGLIVLGLFSSIIITTFTFRHFLLIYPFYFALAYIGFVKADEIYIKASFKWCTIILACFSLFYFILKIGMLFF